MAWINTRKDKKSELTPETKTGLLYHRHPMLVYLGKLYFLYLHIIKWDHWN